MNLSLNLFKYQIVLLNVRIASVIITPVKTSRNTISPAIYVRFAFLKRIALMASRAQASGLSFVKLVLASYLTPIALSRLARATLKSYRAWIYDVFAFARATSASVTSMGLPTPAAYLPVAIS